MVSSHQLVVFYSGDGTNGSDPELVWGGAANIMLTYFHSHGKARPTARYRRVRRARMKAKRKEALV